MDFVAVVDQVIALLRQRGRVAYRTLQRQFQLDDEALADLKIELIDAQHLARDEQGSVLVWLGEPGSPLAPPATPEAAGAQTPLPSAAPAMPEAERRQLTVLFCDLVDSTALSSQLDPEDLREVVRAYQDTCATVIARFDGHIAQYLGDGLLIYFGYPLAHEDDAQRAVRAGLGMVEALGPLNTRLEEAHGVRLAVRLGIHTGLVVVGEVGSGARQEQLALGETPNLAARLQGLATPDTVVISAATAHLIHGYFVCQPLGAHALKGLAQPLEVSQVLRESGAQTRLDVAIPRGLTPLVGREQEVGLLRERWGQVQDRRGQVIILSGEAGIGKSRLGHVLTEYVADAPHTRWECRCSPYYHNTALYPLIDVLQRALHWPLDEPVEAKLDKLEYLVRQSPLPLDEAVPLLATLLSLPLPAERYPPLALLPQLQRQKTFEALLAVFLARAADQPVLLMIEDLHWVDPTTVEWLSLAVDQVPTTALCLLVTCRPEFQVPWGSRSYLTQVTLTRLPRPQIAQMVTHVIGGKLLPPDVLQHVLENTDGVPLFVEELTKTVLESGLLTEREGHYALTRPVAALAIPATLQDSLMARLDRLPTAKGIAQVGATIGRQFSYEILSAITHLDDTTVQPALKSLVEAELLYQRGMPPQATYTFKHALIQEAAYQSLLRSTRQYYHQRIAQVLEVQFPETVETQPELLAHHYTEASLPAQAVAYWRRAGQRAMTVLAYEEAVQYYERALGALEPKETVDAVQRSALLLALGEARMKAGDFPQALDTFHQAADLARQLRSPEDLARAALGFEETSRRPGLFGGPAVHLLEEALDALGSDDNVLRVRVMAGLARALSFASAPERAEEVGQHAIAMARRIGDPAVLAFTLKAHQYSLGGRPERISELVASATEMLTLAEDIGDKERAFDARFWRLFCALELGDIQAVDAELDVLIRVADEMRQPFHVYVSLEFQVMRALLEGRFADAERLAHQGLAVGQRLQGEDPSGVFGLQMFTLRREQGRLREVEPVVKLFVQRNPASGTWQPGLAVIYSELGLEHEAREMFERLVANDLADLPRDTLWITTMTYLADVCAFLGDIRRAALLYQRLLPYAPYTIMVGGTVACAGAAARYLGMLATTMARWDEAEDHFQEALAMNARMHARPALAHTQQQYADMLLARGQPGDRATARSLLDEALASANQLGMASLSDRVLACTLRAQGLASRDTMTS